MLQNEQEGRSTERQRAAKVKDFHPGYSAVLVRTELKDALRKFRADKGFAHESHIERCLISAGIELLLQEKSIHSKWMEMLGDAARQDVLMAAKQQQKFRNT